MRRRIEPVHEPRSLADRGADAQSIILGKHEGFEVVPNERFVHLGLEIGESFGLEQQRLSAESCRQACDRRRRTAERAGQLTVTAPGNEARSNGNQQFGAFEVIAAGETLPRKAAFTGRTAELGNSAGGIALAAIGALA